MFDARFQLAVLVALVLSVRTLSAAIIDFEDLPVPPAGYYNGSDSAGGFNSHGAQFNNSYDNMFASWAGFSYSNRTDTATPGFGNQYSAVTGSGAGGSPNYAVGYDDFFNPVPTITLPAGAAPVSVMITNTTYAYDAIVYGDDGAGPGNGFVRQFGTNPPAKAAGNQGNPDFFKLTITGLNALNQSVGSVDFYLADYRFASNAQDYVVNTWTPVDLSPLVGARTLTFDLASSDNSFGFMNTPGYFALDNLVVTPEPTPATLVAIGLAGIWTMRKRQKHSR